MNYLFYSSFARTAENDLAAHSQILTEAHETNPILNVTGFLYRAGPYFLQYLEGRDLQLELLLAMIEGDQRHENMTILAQGFLDKRLLPDWTMGFVRSDQLSLAPMLQEGSFGLELKAHDPLDLVRFLKEKAGDQAQGLAA